jgi:NADH-quinone oxidoreductase subunit G
MITITIDGIRIETEPTKTIIDAAFENGVYVPHFCWHPALSVSGNCRMCLVEVENMPKQVIACSTLCADGMNVRVNSEKAIDARNAVMEFILINHPLDCPICDEAGECKLQDYAYRYGTGESRFDEEKRRKRKRVRLGPNVMFDAERCISCSRCIRFCDDVTGTNELTFVNRGDRVTIETFPGRTLDNPYSMNVIDICPVGALTSADFRFKARVWEMAKTPGVCPGCSRGCSTDIWTRRNEILRFTPRENPYVNDFWMCDAGRLESWRFVNADTRVMHPGVPKDGSPAETTWEEALAAAADALKRSKRDRIAVIGSPYDTCEDAFALAGLANDVLGTPYLDLLPHEKTGDKDDFLLREDKTPNSTGARMAGIGPGAERGNLAGIIAAMKSGAIDVALVTDFRAGENEEFMSALASVPTVIAAVGCHSNLTARAAVVLPAAVFAEKLGTFVNFQRHMQLVNPAVVTADEERRAGGYRLSRLDIFGSGFDRWGRMDRSDSRPVWKIAAAISELLGKRLEYRHPEDVFDEMTARLPELRGLSYQALGSRGVRLQGSAPQRMLPYFYSDVSRKEAPRE